VPRIVPYPGGMLIAQGTDFGMLFHAAVGFVRLGMLLNLTLPFPGRKNP